MIYAGSGIHRSSSLIISSLVVIILGLKFIMIKNSPNPIQSWWCSSFLYLSQNLGGGVRHFSICRNIWVFMALAGLESSKRHNPIRNTDSMTKHYGSKFTMLDVFAQHHFTNELTMANQQTGMKQRTLQREKFGEVPLPEKLVLTHDLEVTKVNESLGLLEYYDEGEMSVCGVWARKDGENKQFTKMYTVKVEGKSVYHRVLGFRKNGEVVLEMVDDNNEGSEIEIYEPSSGHINGVGINGTYFTFSARSYMETLLLLDQSNSIIH